MKFLLLAGLLGVLVWSDDALAQPSWQDSKVIDGKPKTHLVQPERVGELGPKVKKLGEYLLDEDGNKYELKTDGLILEATIHKRDNSPDGITITARPIGYSGESEFSNTGYLQDRITFDDSNLDGLVDEMEIPKDFRNNRAWWGYDIRFLDHVRDRQDFVQSRFGFVLDLFLSHYEGTPAPKLPEFKAESIGVVNSEIAALEREIYDFVIENYEPPLSDKVGLLANSYMHAKFTYNLEDTKITLWAYMDDKNCPALRVEAKGALKYDYMDNNLEGSAKPEVIRAIANNHIPQIRGMHK